MTFRLSHSAEGMFHPARFLQETGQTRADSHDDTTTGFVVLAMTTAFGSSTATGTPGKVGIHFWMTSVETAALNAVRYVDAGPKCERAFRRTGLGRSMAPSGAGFTKNDGNYVSVPTNVHRSDMIWASKAAFQSIGAENPTSLDELNGLAPLFLEAGIAPLTHMFEAVVAGVAGAELYKSALIKLDNAALRVPEMVAVSDQLAILRSRINENTAGRDWNLATALVINGEAVMQIMGDWAKGEFSNAGQPTGEDFVCIPVPKDNGDAFVYLVSSLSLFAQTGPDRVKAQRVLVDAIIDPEVQAAFNIAKGATPARNDVDATSLDACAQTTISSFGSNDAEDTAVPTFAKTCAASSAIVGAVADAITEFSTRICPRRMLLCFWQVRLNLHFNNLTHPIQHGVGILKNHDTGAPKWAF